MITINNKEIWKDIKGYEGIYMVSDLGRVRSLDKTHKVGLPNTNKVYRKGKVLNPNKQQTGYLTVTLSNENKQKVELVHRLVAKTFIENISNKEQVNHINGAKNDNRLSNLEWVTRSENQKHRFDVLGHEDATKIRIKCLSLEIEADSLMAMNEILTKRNISSPTSYSVLAYHYRTKGKYFKYKGLEFEVIE